MHHKIYVSANATFYWEGSSTASSHVDALEPFLNSLQGGQITIASDLPMGQTPVPMPTTIDKLRPMPSANQKTPGTDVWPCLTFRDPAVILPNPAPIAGFLRLIPDFDGVVCLVTDQSYWVRISAGEACHALVDKTRQMIGAMGPVTNAEAFRAAFDATNGRSSRLGAELAQLEARYQFGETSQQEADDYRLGLAIGAEFASAKPYWLGEQVTVIADQPLAKAYTSMLNHMGCSASELPLIQAVFAGLSIGVEL